ncbi:MAG: myo-inositol-1(or 4)-monophosphatase [Candidatus Omnitrophota bacterium]
MPGPNSKDINAYKRVVRTACLEAAKVLKKNYGKITNANIQTKAKNDFVTFVDKKSQDILINHLSKAFPTHGFKAEEKGFVKEADHTWVIDPVDGTTNFIYQIPAFCISIALRSHGVMVYGAVYDPLHDEWFEAAKGQGSTLNKKAIHVSRARTLSNSLLATGFPFRCKDRFKPYQQSFSKFFHQARGMRRLGSAALDLCYTACGRFEGYWELGLKEWDSAAGSLIVTEAGGVVTDFKGGQTFLNSGDTLAANKRVHKEMLKILKTIRGLPLKK